MNTSIDLDRLKQVIPILDLAKFLGLEVKGKQVRCYNSKAHKNNDQHFSLGLNVNQNRYKCFACNEQGSIIDLYMNVKGIDFNQAIKELSEMTGLTYIAQKTQYKAQEGVQNYKGVLTTTRTKNNEDIGDYSYIFEELYSYCNGLDQESVDYLKNRGLKEKTIERFKLFSIKDYQETDKYLKSKFTIEELNKAGLLSEKGSFIFYKHKIIIPFYENNKIIFLQGRRLDQEQPKYLQISRPVPLFNVDVLTKIEKAKKVYICEGVFDTMILEQYGYRAVGILGVNNFKTEYIDLFKDLDVVLALDNDEAGERGTQGVAKMFMFKGKKVKKKQLPLGVKDITDYFNSLNFNF